MNEESSCELCGAEPEELFECEGFIVCEPCAHEHGSKLAEYRDDLDEDVRGS
jgi:hypothetical protein